MKKFMNILTFVLAVAALSSAMAGELAVGDTAPLFQAKDDRGKDFQSQSFLGESNLVVYFYPAAMTGGCTAQACGFRDAQADFSGLNTKVVGVSGDSVQNLAYFKQAHNLNFPLLADPDGTIAKAFGVPLRNGGEITRTIDDKDVQLVRGVTEARWTFVVDTTGKIVYKDTDVKASEDSQRVLEFLKSRQNNAQK